MSLYPDSRPIRAAAKKTARLFFVVFALFFIMGESAVQAANRQEEYYCLQIGRYREEQQAIELVQAMKNIRQVASYEKVKVEGFGERYRVYLGRYPNRRAAMEAGQRFIKNKTIQHFIIREASFIQSAASSPAEETAREDSARDRNKPVAVPSAAPPKPLPQAKKDADLRPPPPPAEEPAGTPVANPEAKAPLLSGDPLLAAAAAAFQSGQYQEALAQFTKALNQQGMDAGKKEFVLRYIADCCYFIGEKGSNRDLLNAIDRYKEILTKYPDAREPNATVLYRLAKSYERLNFWYEARREFDTLCSRYPESSYLAESLFTAGDLSYRVKRYSDAVERLKQYVTRFPEGDSARAAYFNIADSYSQLKQIDMAEQWYREALKRWPDWESIPRQILLNLGSHYFRNTKFADAADMFFIHINLYPGDANNKDTLYILARCLVEMKQYPIALKMLGRLIERYPESKQAWEGVAIMANLGVQQPGIKLPLFMTGVSYYRDPIGTYNAMLKKFPYGDLTEGLLFQKGYALWKARRFKEAFYTYAYMARQFPRGRYRAEGMANLALNAEQVIRDSYAAGDYLFVAEVYFRTYEQEIIRSEDGNVMYCVGDGLRRIGFYDEAVKVFEALSKAGGPDRNKVLLGVADCRFKKGDDEGAEAILKNIPVSSKGEAATTASVQRLLADIHYKRGLFEKAASLYADALSSGAELENKALIYRNCGAALRELKSYSSASKQYQHAIESYNKEPQRYSADVLVDAYAGLGDCLFGEKRYQESIQTFKKVPDGSGESFWALFNMARGYARLDHSAQSDQTLASLREKGGEGFWAQAADFVLREENWVSKYGKYVGGQL